MKKCCKKAFESGYDAAMEDTIDRTREGFLARKAERAKSKIIKTPSGTWQVTYSTIGTSAPACKTKQWKKRSGKKRFTGANRKL